MKKNIKFYIILALLMFKFVNIYVFSLSKYFDWSLPNRKVKKQKNNKNNKKDLDSANITKVFDKNESEKKPFKKEKEKHSLKEKYLPKMDIIEEDALGELEAIEIEKLKQKKIINSEIIKKEKAKKENIKKRLLKELDKLNKESKNYFLETVAFGSDLDEQIAILENLLKLNNKKEIDALIKKLNCKFYNLPLISKKYALDEYYSKNFIAAKKTIPKFRYVELHKFFDFILEVSGDGNCFYRAFIVSLIAVAIITRNFENIKKIIDLLEKRFENLCAKYNSKLLNNNSSVNLANIENVKIIKQYLIFRLKKFCKIKTLNRFINNYNKNALFDYCMIVFIRFLIADFLSDKKAEDLVDMAGFDLKDKNQEKFNIEGTKYENFFYFKTDMTSKENFIEKNILCYGHDAEQPALMLVYLALKIPFLSCFLNSQEGDAGNIFYDFYPLNFSSYYSFVSFRLGHYNALIPKKEAYLDNQVVQNRYLQLSPKEREDILQNTITISGDTVVVVY